MKTGYIDITFIVDKSGSMSGGRTDTIGMVDNYIQEQKKKTGDTKFTLINFDENCEFVYKGIDVKDISKFTEDNYAIGGMTALNDAIGKSINEAGARFAALDESERPEKVLFVILTDGHENSSKEFTRKDQINEMINHQKTVYSWEFLFLGADQDAIAAGASLGIDFGKSMTYTKSHRGMEGLTRSLNRVTDTYRSTDISANVSFNSEERKEQENA